MKTGDKIKYKGKIYTIAGFQYQLSTKYRMAGADTLEEAKSRSAKGQEDKIKIYTTTGKLIPVKECTKL